jgi:uncharacterized C2H2 Zn-finger protein
MKTKKTGWPKARPAHSFESREGQAWRPGKVLKEGTDIFGNKKTFLVEEGHFRCKCGAIVRIDKNGFAACESCGEVFNDRKTVRGTEYHMSKAQKKRELERFKASLVKA